jgi:hypothetical protein
VALFLGLDLTDAFAAQPRPIDVAGLDSNAGTVAFTTFNWPVGGGDAITAEWVEGELRRIVGDLAQQLEIRRPELADVTFIVDGPQGLATTGNDVRQAEIELRAPGRTPSDLPQPLVVFGVVA